MRSAVPHVLLLAMAALCLTATLAWAQEADEQAPAEDEEVAEERPPIVPEFSFEDEEGITYWYALDGEAELALTREKDHVARGQASLAITYTPRAGVFCLFGARNLEPLAFQSLRCAVKTDLQTPLVFTAQEEDGSKYHFFTCIPQDQWTEVALDVGELMLTEDSQDENDQLDTEQVTELTLADLSNLEGESGRALGHKFGEQHLYLDDVQLSPEPGRKRSVQRDGDVRVDGFETPFISALPLGSVKLILQPGAPDTKGRSSLRITYRLGGHRWAGIVTGIGYLDLAGITQFSCQMRSSNEGKAQLVLEERDGSKYQAELPLDGAGRTRPSTPHSSAC
jgi:hypothetical protein